MAWIEKRGARWRVRYRTSDGTVATDSTHATPAAAQLRAKQVDVDQAYGTYLDPGAGRITLAQWVTIWQQTHIVGPAKHAAYQSHLRVHILPSFGHLAIAQITRQDVKRFVARLRAQHTDSTVTSITSLLGLLLREAVADRRIGYNPCQHLRIATGTRPERPHATPAQVNRIAGRISRPIDQALVITAAYTGMRWGELVGLQRRHLDLPAGIIHVDAAIGALHEVGGRISLGPPKTAASARDIHLPEFLTQLLADTVGSHTCDMVFPGSRGKYLRRNNFNQRVWTPAASGDPTLRMPPVIAGMHFHDLRHTHKTWLIEDDIPEIAQAKRLGHTMAGVRGIYSHVTPAMQQRIQAALQRRWLATQTDAGPGRPRAGHAA